MALKGQNLRVFIGSKAIACATNCTIHLGTIQDDASTKDSEGDWDEVEVTGKNWDVQCDALVFVGTDAQAQTFANLLAMHGTKVSLKFDETTGASGTKNRTAANTISHSGQAWLTDVNISAQNRQKATGSFTFKGTGALS